MFFKKKNTKKPKLKFTSKLFKKSSNFNEEKYKFFRLVKDIWPLSKTSGKIF